MIESRQNKKTGYQIWQPALLALFTILGMIAGIRFADRPGGGDMPLFATRKDQSRQLTEIIRFIEEKYVDQIDSDALIVAAVNALLGELDPHSGYLSPDEVREMHEQMEGHFHGIGVHFNVILDTIVVLHLVPGGPAEKAGLQKFDRLVANEDFSLVALGQEHKELIRTLRGKKGSTLNLKVRRPGVDSMLTIGLVRDEIQVPSIETSYMLDATTGYIKISRFSAKTYREFMNHLERLVQDENMQDLIIDVRHNPGGYLKEAVNILSQLFEEKGLLLVYTEGTHSGRTEYKSAGKPFYKVGNIAVLIDEGSASASEIIAGALQDHDRGVIIGTETYGKGLVQEQYPLSNGGALRLTVARYYTPSGRLIQRPYGRGSIDSMERYFTTDGREVLSQGGISPDITVEPLISKEDKNMSLLYDQIREYSLHGLRLDGTFSSLEELEGILAAPADIAEDLIAYFEATGRTRDTGYIREQQEYVRLMVLGMVASTHLQWDMWHRTINTADPVISAALEVIKEDRRITLKR